MNNIKDCTDCPDRPDQFSGRVVKKRISMREMADRLKADVAETILSDSLSRHEYHGSDECVLQPAPEDIGRDSRDSRDNQRKQWVSEESRSGQPGPLVGTVGTSSPDSSIVDTPDPVFPDYSSDCPAEWIAGVARLRMALAPASYPERAWINLQRDADAIMFYHGPQFAAAGWTAIDLFGAHPDVPYAALWCSGLALVLGGDTVVEITSHAAKTQTRTGSILTYTRRPREFAVPVWTCCHLPGDDL